ncbi:MAG: putative glycoside hydrolase [Clostridiales bacterium]|nr:putative glycoside hydrolase [Clostridiales bacterium]
MKRKRTWIIVCGLLVCLLLCGCRKLQELDRAATTPAPIVVEREEADADEAKEAGEDGTEPESGDGNLISDEADGSALDKAAPEEADAGPIRTPVQVKGIYISAYVAGTTELLDNVIAGMDRTEANALVIDLKDDYGRVVCEMDSPLVTELGSVKTYIGDMEGLMRKLDEHDIYAIARIPAFRDAWLGEVRPDWCVQQADGSVFRDRDGNAWVNPYRREAWDYLLEIATEAKKLGFDEVQFDYVRFCTERGMQDCVFAEEDTQGRSRTDIILEFMEYAYEILRAQELFVSADVFGAIINNDQNANNIGQIYGEMAKHLDYISPMIYPSHYADGNYGIDHPDLHPYETIRAALEDSCRELYAAGLDGSSVAAVRPWLQDFTASWLASHIPYGADEVRTQIQAVYDSGYDEWLLWDASCHYSWDGLLTPEAAVEESAAVAASREALPETDWASEDMPAETSMEAEASESGEAEAQTEPSADLSLEGKVETANGEE